MRIYISLTPNTEIVPFNYQAALVGAFHKWLGPNEVHDEVSLYSFSWLKNGKRVKNGLDFPSGSSFFISAPNEALLKKIISGLMQDSEWRWGMKVESIVLRETPSWGDFKQFWVDSPVLIKRSLPGKKHQKYFFPDDPESSKYLTESLENKMRKAGIEVPVKVEFDPAFRNPKPKKITYNNIDIKATFCPVIISGAPEAISFAWDVGIGNLTGLGFGALR